MGVLVYYIECNLPRSPIFFACIEKDKEPGMGKKLDTV